MHVTLSPAYGRDFKSREKAVGSWLQGQDWIIEGPPLGAVATYLGKPTSIRDSSFLARDFKRVRLRFNKLQDSVDVDLKGDTR